MRGVGEGEPEADEIHVRAPVRPGEAALTDERRLARYDIHEEVVRRDNPALGSFLLSVPTQALKVPGVGVES
jgi:hypothetical protein